MVHLHANAIHAALTAIIASAGGGASLRFYSGTVPSANDGVNPTTLITELACSNPCGIVSGKGILLSVINGTAARDGVATYFRLVRGDGSVVLQGPTSQVFVGGARVSVSSRISLLDDEIPTLGYLIDGIAIQPNIAGSAAEPSLTDKPMIVALGGSFQDTGGTGSTGVTVADYFGDFTINPLDVHMSATHEIYIGGFQDLVSAETTTTYCPTLLKLKKDGTTDWHIDFTYGGVASGSDMRVREIATVDSFVICAGMGVAPNNSEFGFVACLDAATGNQLWFKPFANADLSNTAFNSVTVSNGSIYVGGREKHITTGLNTAIIVKLDMSGNTIWKSGFQATNDIMYVNEMCTASNGDLIVAGYVAEITAWVARINASTGAMIWQNGADNLPFDTWYSSPRIALDSSDNTYFIDIESDWGNRLAVTKFSSTGSVVWQREIGWPNDGINYPSDYSIESYGNRIFLFAVIELRNLIIEIDTNGAVVEHRVVELDQMAQFLQGINTHATGDSLLICGIADVHAEGREHGINVIRLPIAMSGNVDFDHNIGRCLVPSNSHQSFITPVNVSKTLAPVSVDTTYGVASYTVRATLTPSYAMTATPRTGSLAMKATPYYHDTTQPAPLNNAVHYALRTRTSTWFDYENSYGYFITPATHVHTDGSIFDIIVRGDPSRLVVRKTDAQGNVLATTNLGLMTSTFPFYGYNHVSMCSDSTGLYIIGDHPFTPKACSVAKISLDCSTLIWAKSYSQTGVMNCHGGFLDGSELHVLAHTGSGAGSYSELKINTTTGAVITHTNIVSLNTVGNESPIFHTKGPDGNYYVFLNRSGELASPYRTYWALVIQKFSPSWGLLWEKELKPDFTGVPQTQITFFMNGAGFDPSGDIVVVGNASFNDGAGCLSMVFKVSATDGSLSFIRFHQLSRLAGLPQRAYEGSWNYNMAVCSGTTIANFNKVVPAAFSTVDGAFLWAFDTNFNHQYSKPSLTAEGHVAVTAVDTRGQTFMGMSFYSYRIPINGQFTFEGLLRYDLTAVTTTAALDHLGNEVFPVLYTYGNANSFSSIATLTPTEVDKSSTFALTAVTDLIFEKINV